MTLRYLYVWASNKTLNNIIIIIITLFVIHRRQDIGKPFSEHRTFWFCTTNTLEMANWKFTTSELWPNFLSQGSGHPHHFDVLELPLPRVNHLSKNRLAGTNTPKHTRMHYHIKQQEAHHKAFRLIKKQNANRPSGFSKTVGDIRKC